MTTAQLRKQANAAPKYGLFIEGAGWLAAQQKLSGVIFTEHKDLARAFAFGFDDVATKLGIWNIEAKRLFNRGVTFEAVSLV